jgi:hypothetical protein
MAHLALNNNHSLTTNAMKKSEDTKGVIRIRKSKAERKRTNNDLQNTTQKTIDRVTQTPLKKYMYFNIVVDLWIYCTGSAIVLQFSFHYVCNISGHVCIKIVDIKFSTHLLIALYVTFYYLFKFESPYSFQYLWASSFHISTFLLNIHFFVYHG